MSNPVFSKQLANVGDRVEAVSVERVVSKIFVMALVAVAAAVWAWNSVNTSGESGSGLMIGSAIGALVVSLVIIFKPGTATYLALPYALLEGLVLGAISLAYERQTQGIAIQAVMLTFGLLFAMLILYRSGIIKVNDKLKSGVAMAMVGIVIYYLGTMLLGLFGVAIPSVLSQGPLAIGISAVIICVACAMLLIDFDRIVTASREGVSSQLEWFLAFGLILTVVWMYLEVLRFLRLLGGSSDD